MEILSDLYKRDLRLSYKRAGIAGQLSASLFYLDMILTPEQKDHSAYKSLTASIKELEDSYYVREEEEELAL